MKHQVPRGRLDCHEQVDDLLDQVAGDVDGFYGDGAFDQRKTYETLESRRIRAIIPPRRNAKIWRHGNSGERLLSRDAAVREIRRRGRRRRKEQIGYHRKSLAETAMCCFNHHLKNREMPNQRTETRLQSKILNTFSKLGLPEFAWK